MYDVCTGRRCFTIFTQIIMSTFCINKTLRSLQNVWLPQTQFIRFRYWKDQKATPTIYRHGYNDKPFANGLLPRDSNFGKVNSLPIFRPKDVWSWRRRMFGQNDYIDILGDGKLHPARIAPGVPSWLRGFKGNEYETLMRKFKYFKKTLPYQQPRKWDKMQTRFEQLYYYFNYRKKVG